MGIEVHGLKEEMERMKLLPEKFDRAVTEELNDMGLAWVADARANTPVDSGNLRRSMEFDGTEKRGSSFMVEVYNNADYASHVEYGHRVKVRGKWTGSVVKGRYMVQNSRRRAYQSLPRRIHRAVAKVESE